MYFDDFIVGAYFSHSEQKYIFMGHDRHREIAKSSIDHMVGKSNKKEGAYFSPRVYFNGPVRGVYVVSNWSAKQLEDFGFLVADLCKPDLSSFPLVVKHGTSTEIDITNSDIDLISTRNQ